MLREPGASLHEAGLTPAANVHIGFASDGPQPSLRPEILALQGPPPSRDEFMRRPPPAESLTQTGVDSSNAMRSESRGEDKGKGKGPKWLKLGKR